MVSARQRMLFRLVVTLGKGADGQAEVRARPTSVRTTSRDSHATSSGVIWSEEAFRAQRALRNARAVRRLAGIALRKSDRVEMQWIGVALEAATGKIALRKI